MKSNDEPLTETRPDGPLRESSLTPQPQPEETGATRGPSVLRAARELRAVGLTVARLGREGWRAAVTDALRQAGRSTPGSSSGMMRFGTHFGRAGGLFSGSYSEEDRERWQHEAEANLAAGYGTASPIVGWDCETCHDSKFVKVGPILPGVGTRLEGMPMPVRSVVRCPTCNVPNPGELIAVAGVPEVYAEWDFETFPADPLKADAVATVRAWCDEWPLGGDLLLLGANGRGKTGLAVAAVRLLCERGVGARFVQVVTLLARVRAGFADDSAERLLDTYRAVPLLVLDDIMRARATAWVAEQIPALVEERLLAGRPTLITSDRGADALLDAYDASFVSRLMRFKRVNVGGDDLRVPA